MRIYTNQHTIFFLVLTSVVTIFLTILKSLI